MTVLEFISQPISMHLQEKHKSGLDQLKSLVSTSPWRPASHIAPPCGLFNDPNGLHFDGKLYHVFAQWYPFNAAHGTKHWCHLISEDLRSWELTDDFIIPDQAYEKNGCYSGNAWYDREGGYWYLYYTANLKDEQGRKIPQQAVVKILEDGTLEKSRKNPIIQGSPAGVGRNIRDPFVFDFKGKSYLLAGAESSGEQPRGMLLMYEMKDPESFDYSGEIRIRLNGEDLDLGTMLECPGMIRTGDKDVLFVSVIGESSRIACSNRFASVALAGEFKPDECVFEAQSLQNLDEGFDFYAPQPFYGKGGQPMFYAWFGCGDQKMPEDEYHWRQALTLPRGIALENGILKTPVIAQAVKDFRTRTVDLTPETDKEEITVSLGAHEHLHIEAKDRGQRQVLKFGEEADYFSLSIDFSSHQISIDRSNLKIPVDPDYGYSRKLEFRKKDRLDLDLYVDHSFFELYVNGGEQVLSFRAYPDSQK